MTVHDFADRLAFSHRAEGLPIWREVYSKAFPSLVHMQSHRTDGEHQRAGIDRSLLLANSKQILIDEKVREKDYGDILLERWSDHERRAPGWIVKPLRADFIAYAVLPSGVCFLLPVEPLQAAWRTHGKRWMSAYPKRDARNSFAGRRWVTRSWAIPTETLLTAIGEHMRVTFTPLGACA